MRILFTALLLLVAPLLYSQSKLVVESFKNSGDFYSAYNQGSGTVYVSNSTSEYTEGTSSMKVDYNISSVKGSSFTCLKNYGTATKDWSLNPNQLVIDFKLGSTNTQFKLRLWEDNNQNGQFDSSDEVYTSVPQILSATSNTWTTAYFKISEFTKVTGSGNGNLDLNRIRAWDIAIENTGTANNSGSLCFDNLILETTYVATSSSSATLNGSFIQLWNTVGCKCGQFTLQQWKDELQKMKDLCLKDVYIQYGVYHDLSWYSPSNLSFVTTEYSALNNIITAAESLGMGVYIGTYFDETWNSSDKSSASTYSNLLTKQQQTIDEIWSLFGSSSAFKGWYLPQEINDLEWQNNPQKNLLFSYVQSVAAYAHSKNSSKKVLIAPFFNLWMPADLLASWYNDFFTVATDLDAVYFQDGVGITLKQYDYHLPLYFSALQAVCEAHGVEFSVTAESFQQLTGWPIDGGSFSATSADINRLKNQIWAAEKFGAENIIQFDWSYMQGGNTTASSSLYKDYKTYANCMPTNTNHLTTVVPLFWPNPAINELNLSPEINATTIYSSDGKKVAHFAGNLNKILLNLEKGTYFIEFVLNENQQKVTQVLVVK